MRQRVDHPGPRLAREGFIPLDEGDQAGPSRVREIEHQACLFAGIRVAIDEAHLDALAQNRRAFADHIAPGKAFAAHKNVVALPTHQRHRQRAEPIRLVKHQDLAVRAKRRGGQAHHILQRGLFDGDGHEIARLHPARRIETCKQQTSRLPLAHRAAGPGDYAGGGQVDVEAAQ